MQQAVLVFVAIAVLCAALIFLVKQYRYTRRTQLRVRKLCASPVYEEMQPFLQVARHRQIERLSIDKTGILFEYMYPTGSRNAFLMKNYGFAYLTREQQDAMCMLLEQCLPKLADDSRYLFKKKKHRLTNGDVEYSCRYVMANGYKMTLARAAYYDPKLQAKLR